MVQSLSGPLLGQLSFHSPFVSSNRVWLGGHQLPSVLFSLRSLASLAILCLRAVSAGVSVADLGLAALAPLDLRLGHLCQAYLGCFWPVDRWLKSATELCLGYAIVPREMSCGELIVECHDS